MAAGVVEEFNLFGKIAMGMEEEAGKIVSETALAIERDVKIEMAKSKSGRLYGAHQASAPGEAPAIDSTALASSIQARKLSRTAWEVNVGQEYGIILEFGSARMAARPFLGPAVKHHEKPFLDSLKKLGSK